MINRHDSMNLVFVVVLGIILLISLLLVKPIKMTTNANIIGNIGLPQNAIEELKKLLNP